MLLRIFQEADDYCQHCFQIILFHLHTNNFLLILHMMIAFFVFIFCVCSDGQLYVVILRNQLRNTNTGPVGAEIVLYQLQRFAAILIYTLDPGSSESG